MKNVDYEAIHGLKGSVRYLDQLKDVARNNRNNPTEAEKKIWNEVLKKTRLVLGF